MAFPPNPDVTTIDLSTAREHCQELNQLVSARVDIRNWFVPSDEVDLDAVVSYLYKMKRPFSVESQHYLKSSELSAFKVVVFAKRTFLKQYSLCVSPIQTSKPKCLTLKQEGGMWWLREHDKEKAQLLFDRLDFEWLGYMRYGPYFFESWEYKFFAKVQASFATKHFVRSDVPLCLSPGERYVSDAEVEHENEVWQCRLIGRQKGDTFVCGVLLLSSKRKRFSEEDDFAFEEEEKTKKMKKTKNMGLTKL